MRIFKENNKTFVFQRKSTDGSIITTIPQGMWFTVKDKKGSVVISKKMGNGIIQGESGEWLISILPLDTLNLPPAEYLCDVKIKNEQGLELTIVPPQIFEITEAVTLRENQI